MNTEHLSPFTTLIPWLEIVLRTGAVYAVVLLGLRLTGKRQVGQLSPFDLVLLLLLSNSVQNAMTGPDNSLTGGILAASTLLFLNACMAYLAHKNRKLSKVLSGSATMLINHGQIMPDHLAKENITHEELLQAMREHGIASVAEVRLAVLEVDGSISIIKNEDLKPEYHQARRHIRQLKRHPNQ